MRWENIALMWIMNGNKRLIEILKDNQGDNTYYITDEAVQKISDILLENGVAVLPCKIGDTIYIADENSNEFDGIDECRVEKLEWNGIFWTIFHNRDDYGYLQWCIGKTIFFTREEAEQALKGGNKDE